MRSLLLLTGLAVVTACSSIDLPSIEDSRARISRLQGEVRRAETPLRSYERRFTLEKDARSVMKISVLNAVLGAMASQRSDDLTVLFPPTRSLLQERKNVLGIGYTNRLDIDSGSVTLNLKRAFTVTEEAGTLGMFLELEGSGRIAVSGKHTGIPASSSPRIELHLQDTVIFALQPDKKSGAVLLRPKPKTVLLTAVLHISLLGWEVPWEEEIPLDVADLIPEIPLPGMVQTRISIPVPAEEFGDKNYQFIEMPIILRAPRTQVSQGRIYFDSDVLIQDS